MPNRTARPFLGETADRNKAFPDIDAIDITITQDPSRQYLQHDWQRVTHYTKSTIPRYAKCANPRCQQGGLDLQHIVMFASDGEHEYYCDGHEGTPAGRRKGDPCENRFTVRLAVTRRSNEE